MSPKHILIISPASAKANNGNWQTARRWQRFLQRTHRVSILQHWDGRNADLMIALHARRSAASLAAFAASHPHHPLILALTGTDLYRDIESDADARRSLQLAKHLVVLQSAGLQALPAALHDKTSVIYQSAPSLRTFYFRPNARHFDVCMIGHLRDEKDPLTFMRAAALAITPNVRFVHIGGTIDPALELEAIKTQEQQSRYRWLGGLPHARTRQLLKRSRLMVIASRMEGGANVIIEAVTSGVPVLASDIAGNRGMLGDDYPGYFAVGDAQALARLIDRAANDATFYASLKAQCALLAPRFSPATESTALLQLVDNAINQTKEIS